MLGLEAELGSGVHASPLRYTVTTERHMDVLEALEPAREGSLSQQHG